MLLAGDEFWEVLRQEILKGPYKEHRKKPDKVLVYPPRGWEIIPSYASTVYTQEFIDGRSKQLLKDRFMIASISGNFSSGMLLNFDI